MTTTVHIWLTSPGHVGHVSLSVGSTYISYWPSSAAGKKDFKINQSHAPAFPGSYKVDRRLEGGECQQAVALNKVDEAALLACWAGFKANPRRYNMVRHNCSTVVAWLLEQGSGVPPGCTAGIQISDWVSNPLQRLVLRLKYFGDQIDMWTPDDVYRYALQIKSLER